jgi:hypothetical protein
VCVSTLCVRRWSGVVHSSRVDVQEACTHFPSTKLAPSLNLSGLTDASERLQALGAPLLRSRRTWRACMWRVKHLSIR